MKRDLQKIQKTIVKGLFAIVFVIPLGISNLKAQALSGVLSVPGTYSSIKMAIDSLNQYGIGAGGVTINVAAGYREVVSAPLILTATGTQSNPIIFKKNGIGENPLVKAFVGTATPAGSFPDGIWALSGSDYVTIDGIDLLDSNTANPATMEYGYGLFKASGINGAQHNIIQNCVVTLSRMNNSAWTLGYHGSVGILLSNTTYNDAVTGVVVTNTLGSNSFNKLYNNTIQNCNTGISLYGYVAPSPFNLGDTLNDIGGLLQTTGNRIFNFGGAVAAANPAAAIYAKEQWGLNISYNEINNNNGLGVNHIEVLKGIYLLGSIGASTSVTYNTLTLKSGVTTAAVSVIENASGSSSTTNSINISDNVIRDCSNATATTGGWYGIYNSASIAELIISRNSFINNSTAATSGLTYPIFTDGIVNKKATITENAISMAWNGGTAYSGNHYGIYTLQGANTAGLTISNNTFSNYSFSLTGTGFLYFIYNRSSSLNLTIDSNAWDNITLTHSGGEALIYNSSNTQNTLAVRYNKVLGAYTRTGASGSFWGINSVGSSPANTIQVISHNTISNVSGSLSGTGLFYGIYTGDGFSSPFPRKYVFSNTVSNISYPTTGSSHCMYVGNLGESQGVGSKIYNNTISNISVGGILSGIITFGSSPNFAPLVYENTIRKLTSSGASSAVIGLNLNANITVGVTAYANKIYDIQSTGVTAPTAYGISLPTNAVYTVYNNLISDIRVPNASANNAVVGIYVTGGTGKLITLYNNTVYLNASGVAANFGSSAIYSSTNPILYLRNNIFVNQSTPSGTGLSVAYRRSSTNMTSYSILSNNNIFYAGDSTLASHQIFNDGTNADNYLSAYKVRTGGIADSLSHTENVSFLNTDGNLPDFLAINPLLPTVAEAGGLTIPGLLVDANGNPRPGNPSYTGASGTPDIGGIEGEYAGLPINQMFYKASSLSQVTGNIPPGSTNVTVLRIAIQTEFGYNSLEATRFKLTTTGTTNNVDVTNAKIYYTGSDSNYSATTLFGSIPNPGDIFNIDGSKGLLTGLNYFWLVYDISSGAVPTNIIDATVDSIILSGQTYFPSVNNPTGYRLVTAPLNGDYGVGTGQVYTTIKAAINDLNLLGVSGPVKFILKNTYYGLSTGESFPITLSSYAGSSAMNTVTIRPEALTAVTIASNSSVATFDINGASNYIIDGRQDGSGEFIPGSNMVIIDSLLGPAVRFINDADSNQLLYADFRSNNQGMMGAIGAGVINLGTTTGTNGNSDNQIRFCDIHSNSIGYPINGIHSLGSSIVPNKRNVIDSCNIYDFFNGPLSSNGICVLENNSDWSISNNHIYQQSVFTYVGAAKHRAICINTNLTNTSAAGSNNTIEHNFIGGNNRFGSGLLSFVGNTGSFIAIDIAVGSGIPTHVYGNTVRNIIGTGVTISTTNPALAGIWVSGGNVNITENTIGSTSNNGSIKYISGQAGGMVIGIGVNAAKEVSILNNVISGVDIDASNATTTSADFMGVWVNAVTTIATVSNNLIGDTLLNNSINHLMTASASVHPSKVAGIYLIPTSGNATYDVTNNRISNINSNYSSTGVQSFGVRGIQIASSANTGVTFNISGNIISNLRSASRTTGSGLNAKLAGISVSAGNNAVTSIVQNEIHSLTVNDTSNFAAVKAIGIVLSGASSGVSLIGRNKIHSFSLKSANANTSFYGIDLLAGNISVVNNMIRLGIDSSGSSITKTCSFIGINKTAGTSNVYFNTVYIGGAGVVSGTRRTYALYRMDGINDDIRNNIFINERANLLNSTGHFSVGLKTNSSLTMDYNLLNATDSIGVLDSIPFFSLANWKVASGVDANSIHFPMVFANSTGDALTVDLHVDTLNPTPIEGYGVAVSGNGTDVDFDGSLRNLLSPVDLGAHAADFDLIDIAAPSISYTNFSNTLSVSDRVLTATIVDATGVYTTGILKPKIYYKKSFAGSWIIENGLLVSGTGTNGTWEFTISATNLGGLISDDSIYYFVVAQDSSVYHLLGSFPGGVEGTDINGISTYPEPNKYKITPLVSGIINVGDGHVFTTLTSATGLFNYLNTAVIDGNVMVNITSDIEEPGTFGLNELNKSGEYAVKISPDASAVRNISGHLSGAALIRLSGADRVVIDGSFDGTGRFLRFVNRNPLGSTISLSNDSDLDTIANSMIEGVNNTIGMLTFLGGKVNGTGNDSNVVINCVLRDTIGATSLNKPYNAIVSQTNNVNVGNDYNSIVNCEVFNVRNSGVNLTITAGNSWTIYGNKFYRTDTSYLQNQVILIAGGGSHLIRKNSIGGADTDRSGSAYFCSQAAFCGIFAASSSSDLITIDSNSIGNIAIGDNNGIYSFYGISNNGSNVLIRANMIGGGLNPWDTISSGYEAIGCYITSGNAVVDGNTIAHLFYRNMSTGEKRTYGIYALGGTTNIINNNIHDIYQNALYQVSLLTNGYAPVGIYYEATTPAIIKGNHIFNIDALNGYAAAGIVVSSSVALDILGNRIYNVTANGSGIFTNRAIAAGVVTLGSGLNTLRNNQITLGTNTLKRVYGVYDLKNAGTNNYYYNSIFIDGITDASVDSNTYGIYSAGQANARITNNIIYNSRVSLGLGQNYAVGSNKSNLSLYCSHNLLSVTDTSYLVQFMGMPYGWKLFDRLYTLQPNTNWSEPTSDIPVDSLFSDITLGDLNIVTDHSHAWYANGKGIALSGISGDYNNASGVRSVTTAGGATDIGSVEFTPTTLPPVAFADKVPVALDSTQFFFASRLVAKANWDSTGTLPSAVSVRYHSGETPANTGGKTSMNAYWNIEETGGSGYVYGLTLMADSAVLGTVSNVGNLSIARYNGLGWDSAFTTVNAVTGFMNASGRSVVGVFTGTDALNNPLPVSLTSFTATVHGADVLVAWTTASETNNAGFEVERSVDGKQFAKIGFVKGAGNSNTLSSYTLLDAKTFAKTNSSQLYYRLKQVDLNGGFEYSKVVRVTLAKDQQLLASIFPNPFSSEYTVYFKANQGGPSTIELVDIQGKKVNIQTTIVNKGMNTVTVNNLEGLQSGIYFVKVTVNGETLVMKLVKQ